MIGAVGVYVATLVAIYFAVALAAASAEVLDGRDATGPFSEHDLEQAVARKH